jgi:pimeloyl-ACP methyl ester carboxylesterase
MIVLLPGMDGSGALFADFSSELAARTIVISYPPDVPLGYAELRGLVRASLPVGEPFILLAESFSGPIAIALAAEQPPQLKAVVLVSTFARLPLGPFRSLLAGLGTMVPWWRAPVSVVGRAMLGRFRSVSSEAELERVLQQVSPEVWRARLRAVIAVDETSSLCRILVPVLYLRASKDRVVFPSASAVISERVPRMKVVEIEAPHFVLQARPRESAAAVSAFAHEHGIAL